MTDRLARTHPFRWGFQLFDELRSDVRFALRGFRKQFLLSVAVVVTPGLGLGLNTGVFTLINASLFRAHVDSDPGTFFRVRAYYSDGFAQRGVSLKDFEAYRSGVPSVRELAGWDDVWTTLGARDPVTIRVGLTTCDF